MAKQVNKNTGELGYQPVAITPEGELQVAAQATAVLQEIQGAMILAKKFPRDYKSCWQKFNLACKRKALATKAEYKFPRGKGQVKGATVVIARVGAQCWGNIRWGFVITRDDEGARSIIGWAWDIEENNKVEEPATFKKLIYRKDKGWIKPDERELRELTNRHAAICIRNSLLQILPRDYIDDAIESCRETLAKGIDDPRAAGKEIISAFGDLGVTVEMLNNYLGHDQWVKDDIVDLQAVLNAIQDGQAKANEFFGLSSKPQPEKGGLSTEQMSPGDAAKHQGYDDPQGKPESAKGETASTTKDLIAADETIKDLIELGVENLVQKATTEMATIFADDAEAG